MANAFDNRNLIADKQQQTFGSVVTPSTRIDRTNPHWETTSLQRLSPKPNHHPPPSYEESVLNRTLTTQQNSKSSMSNDSTYRFQPQQQQQQPLTG